MHQVEQLGIHHVNLTCSVITQQVIDGFQRLGHIAAVGPVDGPERFPCMLIEQFETAIWGIRLLAEGQQGGRAAEPQPWPPHRISKTIYDRIRC